MRDELAQMTAADVNRAIRKHLQTDNMEFVFVAKDAANLREALMNDVESPITYNSPKPELEAEDRVISVLPLRFRNVEIMSGEEVFK